MVLWLLLVVAATGWADSKWFAGADGFAEATKVHEGRGKPMWVYFYTDWCGYCRRLDREILSSDAVSASLDDVVAVRINPEQGPQEQALASRFGVTGFPSFFVIGNEAGRPREVPPFHREGKQWMALTPAEFVTACRAAAEKPRAKKAGQPASPAGRAHAGSPRQSRAPSPRRPPPPPPPDQATLFLKNGSVVIGRLVRETPDAVTLRLETGERSFNRTEIDSFEGAGEGHSGASAPAGSTAE